METTVNLLNKNCCPGDHHRGRNRSVSSGIWAGANQNVGSDYLNPLDRDLYEEQNLTIPP